MSLVEHQVANQSRRRGIAGFSDKNTRRRRRFMRDDVGAAFSHKRPFVRVLARRGPKLEQKFEVTQFSHKCQRFDWYGRGIAILWLRHLITRSCRTASLG